MSIQLTRDQEQAFQRVKLFFSDEENPAIVIKGSAGVGKTTLTKYIVDYIMDSKKMAIAAIAPTHKARRVLNKKLNQDRFLEVPSLTIASILGKMREHSYIGTHKYTNGSKQKMDLFGCFIIDEISMVSDNDMEEIIDYVCEHDKKLILIGDNCQIPAPSQQLVVDGAICYKPDSTAFDILNICELRQIVRQASDSPIIRIATYLRDNLLKEQDLPDTLHGCGMDESEICISHEQLYPLFQLDWKSGMDTRVIAYTNSAVRSHNQHIREDLGYQDSLEIKELLTGYSNVGWPVPVIENGTDYKIFSIRETSSHQINSFGGLVGKIVDLVDWDDPKHVSRGLFFINVQHSSNLRFMQELVRRAEKVNSRYSTKNDYKNYCSLKNSAVFLEDVYKYQGKILTETILRQLHPLLFTKVSEIIDIQSKSISISELTRKIEARYGEIIEGRLIDNKPFADAEVFADQYMMVEKDIYYGYSITAHKCCAADTLIYCKDGMKRIGHISKTLHPDQEKLTTKEASFEVIGKTGANTATQIYKGDVEETIIITTSLGYKIEGSNRHPIMTYDGSEKWKKLPEIVNGDYIMLRSGLECYGINIATPSFPYIPDELPPIVDERLGYVFGMLLGDGCYSQDREYSIEINVSKSSPELKNEFMACFKDSFGVDCECYNRKDDQVYRIMNNSEGIRTFMIWCGLDYVAEKEKSLPWTVLENTKSVHSACLRGLFDSAGDVGKRIHFTTISKRLAEDVGCILLNMGIISSLKPMMNNQLSPQRQSYRLDICGYQAYLFWVKIGFGDIRKQSALEKMVMAYSHITKSDLFDVPGSDQMMIDLQTSREFLSRQWLDSGVFFDTVEKIEKSRAQLYDIYVPGDHTFIGNGIVNHNSQGSTYNSVYVDENDFKKISNKWNYKLRAVEQRHKERNQLKYVAYTRASEKLRIVV